MNSSKFSIIKPERFPFFYGYVVLFIGSIGILASIPGQTVGVSVFTDPVKDALGLTRNEFSNAYMLGTLVSGFFVARAGVLFDLYGARTVAFFASLFLGLSLVLASLSSEISMLIQSFLNIESWVVPFLVMTVLFFFIRFSGQGVLTMASRNMIMMWFDRNRGKVNSISSITISLGFSSAPYFLNKLIEKHDWEGSWQILAVCLFIFSFLVLQFFKNTPEEFNLVPDGFRSSKKKKRRPVETNFTLAEAKKTRAFWVIGMTLAFQSFFVTGFTFHVVSIFGSQDYSRTEALAVFIPISVIAISVSTISNILSDYIEHKYYIFLMITGAIIASIGLLFLSNIWGVYLLIIGLGITGGLFAVINAVTWPRYYGRKYLGSITGKVMSFLVIASAIAPSLFSYSFTKLSSYSYMSYLTLTFLVVLAFSSLKLKNPQIEN